MKLEGVIYCGENLERMRHFPDEFVDLLPTYRQQEL